MAFTVIDGIQKQIPDVQGVLDGYAETIRHYLQEQLNNAGNDEKLKEKLKNFYAELKENLEGEENQLKYSNFNRIGSGDNPNFDLMYYLQGYLVIDITKIPEDVKKALCNGFTIAGEKFPDRITYLNLTLKDGDDLLLSTNFKLYVLSNNLTEGYLTLVEMTPFFNGFFNFG